MPSASPGRTAPQWTFLTNHAHVLLCIVQSPAILMRDLATRIGITERAVQRIIADLQEAGYLETERQGRCNHYRVLVDLPLRHHIERHRSVASLIELILQDSETVAAPPRTLKVSSGARVRRVKQRSA